MSQNVGLKAPLLSRHLPQPLRRRRRQPNQRQASRRTVVKPSMRANAPAVRIGKLTRPPVRFPPERSGRNIGATATSARKPQECELSRERVAHLSCPTLVGSRTVLANAGGIQASAMSALPPKADIRSLGWHVCFVPIADSCSAAKDRYSINSSARVSSVGGTVRPSVLAVLRLMTNSNLVGACTGRLAGLSPLRMRAT